MKTISQSEFTGLHYRLTDEIEAMYEIYDETPANRKGWVHVLMKKHKYGIQEYQPSTRKLGRWTAYNNLGTAVWDFDKLKNTVHKVIAPFILF